MGTVKWHCSGIVAAPVDVVYAWMTDFTNDDHSSEAYRRGAGVKPDKKGRHKPSTRTIVERNGNVLKLRDQWDGNDWTQTVTLDPASHSYRIDGIMGYVARWQAIPEGPHATRVQVDGELGKGLMGLLARPFAGRFQRSMDADFQGHMEDLRETLARRNP